MGLRSLFRKRQSAAVFVPQCGPEQQEPKTPEQLAELVDAWAELAAAAKESGVENFHACSRSGKPWQEDPASVRGMAAILRALRKEVAVPELEPFVEDGTKIADPGGYSETP